NYDDLPVGGPWSNIVDAATAFADPVAFAPMDLNNGSLTWLLVEGDQPLVTDIDTNDNGVIDTASWTVLHDSVGWTTGDTNDACYSDACLTQSSGTPDGASRFPDNDLANHVWAWFNGDVTTNQADTLGRTYDPATASAELPSNARLTPGGDADPITGWDGIIYIDPARGGGGTSWSQAYTDLVDALAGSRISDAGFVNEIWIAEGNAIIGETCVITNDDLIIYGGFTNGMTSSTQRDPALYISGIDGQDSIRVMWVKSSDVTLDGLTIQNGTVGNDDAGGGILFMGDASTANITLTNCVIKSCQGTGQNPGSYGAGFAAFGQGSFDPGLVRIDNCTFDSNRAGQHKSPNGAGAYVIRADAVQITDCVFTNNGGGGGQGFFSGGALYAENVVSLTIKDTLFVRNNGDSQYGDDGYGGAIFIKSPGTYSGGGGFPFAIGETPVELSATYETHITRCLFDGNFMRADLYGTGSGIAAVGEDTSVTIENSAFRGNGLGGAETTSRGGAIFVDDLADVNIHLCVLQGNGLTYSGSERQPGGGAIHAKGGSTVLLKNCILDDNSANAGPRTLMQQETAAITLDHCWIDGVTTNEVTAGVTIAAGVLTGSDPLFASVVSNDFQLASGSPCIDTGDNSVGLATDYVGIPRPLDGDTNGTAIVDMGMFERVEENADSDGDGLSDGFELTLSGTSPVLADTDSDGANDFQEIGADTDPFDPNAFLAITSMTNASATEVGFESAATRTYGLLRTDNLATGTWSTVDGLFVPGTGGILFMSDTNTYAGPQFYRIGVGNL
ncbi:MAG: right-handed parallel beta-helix repeat-containing protein, partial [Kiritimatiellae bacterium]|nr:right-handed parallel beta-helix repeat-containing protein [Kiritimatiellia bacterium]